MFTLKLYQNGPLPPHGRTVIVETSGVWISHCDGGVKQIHTFKKKVGVMDEDGGQEFYVGGNLELPLGKDCAFNDGAGGPGNNYYTWGVLENAQGKTTEMLR